MNNNTEPTLSELYQHRQDDRSQRFRWTGFFESLADKLLTYKDKRDDLMTRIHAIAAKTSGMTTLVDKFSDGTSGPLQDICPFTVMGSFNRKVNDDKRSIIARELAEFLDVDEPVPDSFRGVPTLMPKKSWFFSFENDRQPQDIETLWEVFEAAINFAVSENAQTKAAFATAYNRSLEIKGVAWILTTGLYYTRPSRFMTLDKHSKPYITAHLGIPINTSGPKKTCNADDYLSLLEELHTRFKQDDFPVHSHPELSLASFEYKQPLTPPPPPTPPADPTPSVPPPPPESKTYSIDNIVNDGCFIPRLQLENILDRLRTKKNLILQGPPGTGKTWLAKRLGFALKGSRDESRMRAVQFHPNLSYEDFVRGYRPSQNGRLELVDGPFLEMIEAAKTDPAAHVIVIEEINRGNPAQIFGEILTLIEDGKRGREEALELSYRKSHDERVYVPDNLYVIGTMNIADRSLAMVDLALRRRFAFVELEPILGPTWRNWVHKHSKISQETLEDIGRRLGELNEKIADDSRLGLGPQFRIGHSYVTPSPESRITDAREWFRQIVETEIGPLLDEYLFDQLKRAREERQLLVTGF